MMTTIVRCGFKAGELSRQSKGNSIHL